MLVPMNQIRIASSRFGKRPTASIASNVFKSKEKQIEKNQKDDSSKTSSLCDELSQSRVSEAQSNLFTPRMKFNSSKKDED